VQAVSGGPEGRRRPCPKRNFAKGAARRSSLPSRSSLLFLLLTPGCYAYHDVPPEALSPGVQARVRLEPEAFGVVMHQAAMNQVPPDFLDRAGRGVVGRVTQVGALDLQMELRGPGTSSFRVEVPLPGVRGAGERRLDRKRTAIAATGTILFASAVFASGIVGGTTSLPDEFDSLLHRAPGRSPSTLHPVWLPGPQ
jgi:hypothetical protein